jgi:ELWxxDGT repeat protein
MLRRLLAFLGLGLVLLPLYAGAETASLVYDINSASPDNIQGGFRGGLFSLGDPSGDKALFMASEPGSGMELWVTDGTALGTRLVADLCLGPCSSEIRFMGTPGGVALFVVSLGTEEGGIESTVWRSDGTPKGTYPLGHQAVSAGNLCHGVFNEVFQGTVYFIFMSEAHGCELWRSDGTAAGTERLTDLNPGPADSVPHQMFVLNGRLHFFARDAEGHGLWRLDGASTVLVQRLPGGNFSEIFASAGPRVYFTISVDGSSELWTSDGTAGGTKRLAGVSNNLQVLDGILYFLSTDLDRDLELWRSDGTLGGTRPVTGFQNPLPFSHFGLKVGKLGNLLIFAASDDGSPARLWTSGGAPSSTRLLAGCPGGCPEIPEEGSFHKSGPRLLFAGTDSVHGTELWSTDGTGPGTRLLGDLCNGSCSSNPAGLMAYRGAVYFLADNPEGYALWKTDGSNISRIATLAAERHPFDPFYPSALIGGKLLLPVTDIAMGTIQLWVSDGEPAGTWMITLIGERGVGSNPFPIFALGDRALFIACDGQELGLWTSGGTAATTVPVTGPSVTPCPRSSLPLRLQVAGNLGYVREHIFETNSYRLWRTDGTDAGTFLLPSVEAKYLELPVPFAGKAFFTTSTDLGVSSLWETDGTAAGTRALFDLSGFSFGPVLTPLGPDLFIAIANSLWVTDGTQAGTRQLATNNSSGPYNLVRVGNLVFFLANAAGGLWRTDGTAAGTYPVLFGNGPAYDPADLVAFNGALYFMGRSNPGDARRSLWKTGGTLGTTMRIAEVGRPRNPFYGFTEPALMTVVGQQLFFIADDGVHGEEVWRTDGTTAGTVLTRDIMPGSATSYPLGLYGAKGKLYFNAGDPDHGFELWESDGTEAGTRMVQDISPGVQPSDPYWFAEVGDRLFFSADDGVTGREPWVLPLAGPAGCVPSEQVLCLAGGRFRAEIQWRDFQGNSGRGHAVSLTPDTGYFWFFDSANVEVIIKALDGQGVNGHHWVFYGALSSVEYTLTVTDTQTGAARRYINPPGRLGSVGDTVAFGPLGATGSSLSLGPAAEEWKPVAVRSRTAAVLAPCVPSSTRLCLNGGRFAVEAAWRDFQGKAGTAVAVPLTGDTGYFWFFDEKNVEIVLKVLDGQGLNGKFWVFYGALSSVEYTLTVTDTQTGQTRIYSNPSGRLASVADTGAF